MTDGEQFAQRSLALAQADVRAFGSEVRKAADQMRTVGGAEVAANLDKAAGSMRKAEREASALRGALSHSSQALGALGKDSKHVVAIFVRLGGGGVAPLRIGRVVGTAQRRLGLARGLRDHVAAPLWAGATTRYGPACRTIELRR
jgi:hypothetical protein